MFTLPPGFVTVSEAFNTLGTNKQCNVIAVVVDSLHPAKTRRDWTSKVTLHDHSGFPGWGAPFRFYYPDEAMLPTIGNNGDVLLIRNMKVKDISGITGLTNESTEWAVIDNSSLSTSTKDDFKDIEFSQSMIRTLGPPTATELAYAKQLLDVTDPSIIQQPAKPTSLQVANIMITNGGSALPKQNLKFSLIKDLMPPSSPGDLVFKDILGEIRRIYKTDSRMSVYVTDYTSHELLYNYVFGRDDEEGPDGDRFGYAADTKEAWPGPHGQFTMHVTLWDANAQFGHRELQEGNYVLLKNVHIKMDKNGTKLEGHCRGDKMNMTKVNVTIIKSVEIDSNEQLRALVRRKRAIHKAEGPKFAIDPTKLKRRAEAAAEDKAEAAAAKIKADRNKKKRQKKGRKGKVGDMDNAQDSDESGSRTKSKSEIESLNSTNSEVRIMNFAVPPKPIREIVNRDILARVTPSGHPFYLPYQNCKYKSQVRVVDFYPNDIADFTSPYRDLDYGMLSDQEDEEDEVDLSQRNDPNVKWEWRFFLLVEDAVQLPGQPPIRMELLVTASDGDYLLNMEACNLKKNPRALAKLKEKLFVMWGDLQELKAEAEEDVTKFKPHNRPFACLIKEFGIDARDENGIKIGDDQYERLFRIWGTTVK